MSATRGHRVLLLAYDGSPSARAALERAGEITRPGDEVTIVNVMPEPGVSSRLAPYTEEHRRQDLMLEDAERYLADRGIPARTLAVVGDQAGETLAAAVAVGADLIIVGGRHGVLPWGLGSTGARIARQAGCDVLVVHERVAGAVPPSAG